MTGLRYAPIESIMSTLNVFPRIAFRDGSAKVISLFSFANFRYKIPEDRPGLSQPPDVGFRWSPRRSGTNPAGSHPEDDPPPILQAEGAGFEPAVQLPVRQFSKLVVSATHPSLLHSKN